MKHPQRNSLFQTFEEFPTKPLITTLINLSLIVIKIRLNLEQQKINH